MGIGLGDDASSTTAETATTTKQFQTATPTSSNSDCKRKHEDEELMCDLGRPSEQVFVGGGGEGGVKATVYDLWKSREVQCPQNARTLKKMRTVDLLEMRVLQIQRAMISDEDGDRQIHIAVAQEDLKLVKKLCPLMRKAGIPLDITNYLRQTPLHLAVIVGNAAIVKVLLQNGASVLIKDRQGNSNVHLAVKHFNKDVFGLLLSDPHSRAILDSADYEGRTALHYATLQKNVTAVNYLRNAGANMDAVDGKSGRTSLMLAVLSEEPDMVNLLLKCGACQERLDYSGQSSLELALQTSNRAIIKLLEKDEAASKLTLFINRSSNRTNVDNCVGKQSDVTVATKKRSVHQVDSGFSELKTNSRLSLRTSPRLRNRTNVM